MGLKVKVRRLDRLAVTVTRTSDNNISSPSVSVSPTEMAIPANGTAQVVKIKSNTAWTIK